MKVTMGTWGVLRFALLALACVLVPTSRSAQGWEGDLWTRISRLSIEAIAIDMIGVKWTPRITFSNWELNGNYHSFVAGVNYTGIAYSQRNPQHNRVDFEGALRGISGGTTAIGNDCSGFVSMAWRLERRYTTTDFEADALATGGYVVSRGSIGSAQSTILLPGDALVRSGEHIVLFRDRVATGVKTMEQTPHTARVMERPWIFLAQYRPIRRNAIDEVIYTGSLAATGSFNIQPNSNYYYSNSSGTHSGRLGGSNDADLDLTIYKWSWVYGWQQVASSTGSFSSERIDYNGGAGYYYWKVSAYRGGGYYELSLRRPD